MAFFVVSDALDSETNERQKAVKLAKDNELLADKEWKARLEADQRREQAEALAVRIKFEHYFSKAEGHPDVALVGMASLLPKAAGFEDRSAADSRAPNHDADHDGDGIGVAEEPLTPREIEVLELLAEGLPNKAIAARLEISDQTVKFHVASITGKLGAQNRTDAVRRAVRRGLIAL